MTETATRVVIADDHPAVLIGIAHELSLDPAICITGQASSTEGLIACLAAKVCDIVVMDYAMPGGAYPDGMALLSFIRRRYPDTKVVFLTMQDNPGILGAALARGVLGLVSKADAICQVSQAVRTVHSGRQYLSPAMHALLQESGGRAVTDVVRLSAREHEVLRLYLSGQSVNQIAAHLNRSKKTVSAQKMAAMKKLGVTSNADLFRYAGEGPPMPVGP